MGYKKKYDTSIYFPFISKLSVPKINADVHQEYKLLLYFLSLKRKYMYIFLNHDPELIGFEYKKIIPFTKRGFRNFKFFILNKPSKGNEITMYIYISKKKLKISNPYLETSDNNIFKAVLTDTTIEWLQKSLYIERAKKLQLHKSMHILNTFCDLLTSKYSELELNDIELKSGVIFLLYGLRNMSDIDISVTSRKIFDNNFPSSNKQIDIKNIETTDGVDYDTFMNMLLEPTNFFYYRGIKFMTLNIDLSNTRITRSGHPRAVADYLMVEKLLGDKYTLPEYPKTNKFKKDVKFFIKNRYKVYDYTVNI